MSAMVIALLCLILAKMEDDSGDYGSALVWKLIGIIWLVIALLETTLEWFA